MLQKKNNDKVKFQWQNDEEDDEDYYFEFKIQVDEITKDVSLIVTDFAEEDELEESKMLWDNLGFRFKTSFRRELICSMINSNGTLISSFREIPTDLIQKLHSELSITEKLRYQNGKILFWEQHYFKMIASLRRHRFEIPMHLHHGLPPS